MSTVAIKILKLVIGDKEIELTPQEAKDLQKSLNELWPPAPPVPTWTPRDAYKKERSPFDPVPQWPSVPSPFPKPEIIPVDPTTYPWWKHPTICRVSDGVAEVKVYTDDLGSGQSV